MGNQEKPTDSAITTAMRGLVYVDDETRCITRLLYDADKIPTDFPVKDTHSVVDYRYIEIGPDKFLLPFRSMTRIVMKDLTYHITTEFNNFHKFTSDVKMTFESQ